MMNILNIMEIVIMRIALRVYRMHSGLTLWQAITGMHLMFISCHCLSFLAMNGM